MASNFNIDTIKSQQVTTSNTFEPKQAFLTKVQSKTYLGDSNNNNEFKHTSAFQNKYRTHGYNALNTEIYRPSSLYSKQYGTSNNNINNEEKSYLFKSFQKPYKYQANHYELPAKPYNQQEFFKNTIFNQKDNYKPAFQTKYESNQQRTGPFKYNYGAGFTTQRPNNTNFALRNQHQQVKTVVNKGKQTNFTNIKYTPLGKLVKDHNQTHANAFQQRPQYISGSKVELVHSKHQQLNQSLKMSHNHGKIQVLKGEQVKQKDQYDFRPFSPEDKWRQSKKTPSKAGIKYNIYSCLDQPYDRCLTQGCSGCAFPGNQICAKDDYYSKQWN